MLPPLPNRRMVKRLPLMFSKGDLVYIPQATVVVKSGGERWNFTRTKSRVLDAPLIGIFVDYSKNHNKAEVLLKDGVWLVDSEKIYFNESEEEKNAYRVS